MEIMLFIFFNKNQSQGAEIQLGMYLSVVKHVQVPGSDPQSARKQNV